MPPRAETVPDLDLGRYGRAWRLFDADTQDVISRRDWIRLMTGCQEVAYIDYGTWRVTRVDQAGGLGVVRLKWDDRVCRVHDAARRWRLAVPRHEGILERFRTRSVEQMVGACGPEAPPTEEARA